MCHIIKNPQGNLWTLHLGSWKKMCRGKRAIGEIFPSSVTFSHFPPRSIWSPDILWLFSTPSSSPAASDPLLQRCSIPLYCPFAPSFLKKWSTSGFHLHSPGRWLHHQLALHRTGKLLILLPMLKLGRPGLLLLVTFKTQVYWFAKRGELEKCGQAMMTLVLNEFLEFLVFSQQLPTCELVNCIDLQKWSVLTSEVKKAFILRCLSPSSYASLSLSMVGTGKFLVRSTIQAELVFRQYESPPPKQRLFNIIWRMIFRQRRQRLLSLCWNFSRPGWEATF